MITEYHRPQTIEKALELLSRKTPLTIPLAGGTAVSRPGVETYAVVDIQGLGLDRVIQRGNTLQVGAAVPLQTLLIHPEVDIVLRKCIQLEATYNLRHAASVAGTLVASDGRSVFCAAALALDVFLTVQPGDIQVELGEMLIKRPAGLRGRLVTAVTFPSNVRLAYESVSRTPADLPIVCVAVAGWPSGRTRITLGGFGPAPVMVMDGPLADGWQSAVESACQESGDAWGSAEYRQEMAVILAGRCLADLNR